MKKICILIPYFGKFPKWFELYLYSCSHVKNIDFYYFTDCTIPKKVYSNTKFIRTSFHNYCDLVSKKLNIKFKPKDPYMLVNIKPFLGTIHGSITKKYDFWGYSDIDLVYGDMSYLLNESNLKKYDLITTHSERVAGHFTIIKVGSRYDKIAFKIKDWKRKIVSDKSWLDEVDFSLVVYPQFVMLGRLWRHVFSKFMKKDMMYYFYQKAHSLIRSKAMFIESYTSPIPNDKDVWIYNLKTNNIIAPRRFYKKKLLGKKPLPYLHFLFFKKTPYLHTDNYWRNGFYQIPKNYNFDKGGKVIITRSYIIVEKD